ncbi:hypothetical protein TRFO_29292 [Tritrichomonas foetus]|uniref:Cullin N-terminal domain-containing protein n=1 Tax=Tritrichomonas foetus TaxID=1144522 RepID=A0A1J4K0P3_9EUKA|nr:hypothetical protein TRFO_29292 [Tritrichomonas foetus]|eukprot:OHT03316.1 hypothetical protein TRFO_29292 [Tritrichomonas foetus]
MTTTEEEGYRQIPREYRIAHPRPSICPQTKSEIEPFPTDVFRHYLKFVKNVIPKYELDSNVKESEAITYMRSLFDQEDPNPLYMELEMHLFLVTCQNHQVKLMANPSLTKFSILHHELFLASELIHIGKIKVEMADFCNMMLADIVDLYHNHFNDILEQKFWAKTKSVDDVIHHFLKKEFERMRTLNPYTYKNLTSVAMRKAIDSAPNSSVNKLIQWAQNNSINMDVT